MRPLLEKLILYFKKNPDFINDREKIANIVFSPLNFKKNGDLNGNAYKCKRGGDDLSVNRLNYTTLNSCKRQGLALEKNAKNIKGKFFFGIALLFAKEIRQFANVISSPIKGLNGNKAHAEIQTGFILVAGEVAPSEYNYITDELAKNSRIFKDENVKSKKWQANNINEILTLELDIDK